MHEYEIKITKSAQKQLNKFSNDIANHLITEILKLSTNPRPNNSKKLKGRDGYRIRKGNYRIIYDILDNILVVEVIAVGHRKDIYD